MGIITLLLLALGLTADAFAVSVTNGICSNRISRKNALINGIIFGFFQALMPVLGFYLGRSFSDIVHHYQHFVALLLLGAIGINMLIDAANSVQEEIELSTGIFTMKNLILQGIATSIDAMAAGVSFAVLQINIYHASLLIGAVTFFCCYLGVFIGRLCGSLLGLRARFIGGIILIIIGLKIFVEAYI